MKYSDNSKPFTHCIDLRGKNISLEDLTALDDFVKSNNTVCNIFWGKKPESSEDLVKSIEDKILKNLQEYKYHPNDYTLLLLSMHVYYIAPTNKSPEEIKDTGTIMLKEYGEKYGKYEAILAPWKIHDVSLDKNSGYCGIAYINTENNQFVLANAGADVFGLDINDISTSIEGIFQQQLVDQQIYAYKFAEKVITDAKNLGCNSVTFTGASLGSWLSELTLEHVSSTAKVNNPNTLKFKAVTFDGPGTGEHIERFQSNLESHYTNFDMKNLNNVSYLSKPNIVNTCNKHHGQVFRIYPKLEDEPSSISGQAMSWASHDFNVILPEIDEATGKPKNFSRVLDWPCQNHDIPENKKTFTQALLEKKLDEAGESLGFFQNAVSFISAGINRISKAVEVAKDINNDKADYSQFFSVLGKEGELSKEYKAHYKIEPVNENMDVLVTSNKGSADWYLSHLSKLNMSLLDNTLTSRQLKEIKKLYEIKVCEEPSIQHKYIESSIPVENLRDIILRLIEVNPDAKEVLENPSITNSNLIIKALTPNQELLIISHEETKEAEFVGEDGANGMLI